MKRIMISAAVLAAFLAVTGCTSQRYAMYHRHQGADTLTMMKKQDVISLTKAGVSDSLIVTMLGVSHSWFQLTPQDVLDLKSAGVSDRVINAMLLSDQPYAENNRRGENGYYYYDPYYYYWYPGYYPYWSYPSLYFGYNYYRPLYISHGAYFGGYGYRGGWGGGFRRR
ncbi:MAG TPA: hypothetical protein VMF88_11735 [Bacteroidota bacterium]|nr:hypothetical protein [Bacteroidota bacterium]